jgi:non-canonical (house-cleaning) NTP pyrophosphatase
MFYRQDLRYYHSCTSTYLVSVPMATYWAYIPIPTVVVNFVRSHLSSRTSPMTTMMSGLFCASGDCSSALDEKADNSVEDGSSLTLSSPPPVLRVAVGSTNPSKVRAAKLMLVRSLRRHHHHQQPNDPVCQGFIDMNSKDGKASDESAGDSLRLSGFELDVQGFEVESGVPHQPFGDDETKLGARNRCRAAVKAYKAANNGVAPHLAIGMEGGLEWHYASANLTVAHAQQTSAKTNGDSEDTPSQSNSARKELYCMAWMAVYGRRYVQTACFE